MHEELVGVAEHMKGLGLAALAHALQHTLFADVTSNPYINDLAVLQSAHAAEILIKARIAEQHPLLIFKDIPKSTQVSGDKLNLNALLESGKTLQYNELPEILWATTGYKIKNNNQYQKFGKLRNAIQHFTSPQDRDLMQETLEFVFGVIDPIIYDFWKLYAIDYFEQADAHNHIFIVLLKANISFLIPQAYKEVVEKDRMFLKNIIQGVSILKGLIANSQLLECLDKATAINKIRDKCRIIDSSEEDIYWESYNMLLLKDETYSKWRTNLLQE